MGYKEYFLKNNIKNIEDLFEFAKNIHYGWIDQKKKIHSGVNDANEYSLQSPMELIKNKIGICWDMTELYRCWFSTMTNLKFKTYYIFYEDKKGCPSHSILVFYKDSHVYWFEPWFDNEDFHYRGIHEYKDINELLENFKSIFFKYLIFTKKVEKDSSINNIYIYKYNKPKYHINGFQMREHINHSELIKYKNIFQNE